MNLHMGCAHVVSLCGPILGDPRMASGVIFASTRWGVCPGAWKPSVSPIRARMGRRWRGRDGAMVRAAAAAAAAGTSVLTASRVEEGSGYVRVMGPGKGDGNGIGRLLVVDEFFDSPSSSSELRLRDPGSSVLLESVTYYCDEVDAGEADQRLQHGVRLYLKSHMRSVGRERAEGESEAEVVVPVLVDHVREAASVAPTTVGGGAVVRVVAGTFCNVSAAPPLHDFMMLDVQMRPGSEVSLPLDPSFGFLVYILEGVGIFEPNRFEEDKAPFYQNEGHGLYIPPSSPSKQEPSATTIRTHEWSQLRFILIGAPTS